MSFFCIHCKAEIDPKFKACPFCGELITDLLRRYAGAPIDGKYQVLARLGVGGMGEVYKVLHIHLNSIRVIKLMRPNIAGDASAHERFLREARLATKINHPNVATLFDFSTLDDESFYMVWEFIEGTNLHELISQRGPLSPRYAARLAVQSLMGLDAIHRAGIIHRDVSPENLMIARDDEGRERVKIIDLGIAKSAASEDAHTRTGMFVGKWKYCSPEHLGMLGSGERIDGRADIYSFGIVLFEMLTGVPPFQADTPHGYFVMHASERPRSLREANPAVSAPPELEAMIFRALEKERNKRFATARDFAQAIERIEPLLAEAPGAAPARQGGANVTDEATRVAQRAAEAATVLSVARDAMTMDAAPMHKTLDHGSQAVDGRSSEPRRMGVALGVIVALAVAVGGWLFVRNRVDKPTDAAVVRPPVSGPAAPLAPGRLAINAFPWAKVTSIRNLDNGESVDVGSGLVTPVPVDLAPGRYEITFVNPSFGQPITRAVSVAAGGDASLTVHFVDPSSAALPDFGASR